MLVSHLPCPLPPNQSVICLAPCHQTSQLFALPPTTTSPCHCITMPLHHCVSQSFALPPATKPVSHLPCPLPPHHRVTVLVSHLPCPLPPNQSVICLAPTTTSLHHHVTTPLHHCVSQSFALPPATKPVSHLPCPLPLNQSVICLAPYHRITTSPRHRLRFSPPHGYESDWLMLTSTAVIG